MKYKYKPYQQNVTLLSGIPDIEPYKLKLPDAPPIEQFINYGLPPEKQFFKRVDIPVKVKNLDKLDRAQAIAVADSDQEIYEFIESMWDKRLNGEFQLINGVPTYISPTYWFYLNFWEMDIGLPDFRTDKTHFSCDLEFFWFWDLLVVPSPFCYGAIEMTSRRAGKTYKLGCVLYEPISRNYEWHAALQSKTDLDAEKAFVKAIVKCWRRLPFFFVPAFSNSTFPKKEGLQFTPKSKRGNELDSHSLTDEDELMGTLTFTSSDPMALDGQKLHRAGGDEEGKCPDFNVYERHNVVKFCLLERGQVKGKCYRTSTVEEMEKKGGKYFKAMWDDSDRQVNKREKEEVKVDENGETVTGMWQWFTPAFCNEKFDAYGTSIVETPTEEQKEYLKSVKDKFWWMGGREVIDKEIDRQKNPIKKQEIIRKKPRNIREAFRSATTFSHFNLDILNARLDYFTYGYPVEQRQNMQFGKFQWKNGVFGGEVEFVESDFENARFHKMFLPNESNWANQRIQSSSNKPKPVNTAKFCGSSDTFKYRTKDVKNKKDMSMGAAHIYAYFDQQIDGGVTEQEWLTDDFVLEYLFRPESPDEYCEDVLMIAIYYSCKIYPENNLDNVAMKFKDWGFENYIQVGRKLTLSNESGIIYADEARGGATTNTKTIESMFRNVQQYILNAGKRSKFYRTLNDFKEVEIDNLNPYDLFVSASYCLMNGFDLNNPANAKKKLDESLTPAFDAHALKELFYFHSSF